LPSLLIPETTAPGVAAPVVKDYKKRQDSKNTLAHGAENQLQGAFRADVLVIQWIIGAGYIFGP
jgi:hypothetical protein